MNLKSLQGQHHEVFESFRMHTPSVLTTDRLIYVTQILTHIRMHTRNGDLHD